MMCENITSKTLNLDQSNQDVRKSILTWKFILNNFSHCLGLVLNEIRLIFTRENLSTCKRFHRTKINKMAWNEKEVEKDFKELVTIAETMPSRIIKL